jgi:GTPase SAR1 family protein
MKNTSKISPQIAIVGTEGSGKTILATVLAKRMSSNTEDIFLHPRDWQTAEYVEKVWSVLNCGEWWKSTEAGCTFELQWTFHIGRLKFPMKLIDSAGQDLRELFSKDTYKKNNLSNIHRNLLDYIQNASVVILVVNLLHFRGEPDALKRKQNEFVLKEVIDMFATDTKPQDIAVIFTAWDLYCADITKHYGNFAKYLQQELPQLYNAIRLGQQAGDSIYCFPVAAVMDTEIKNNIRVPKPNFRSGGLDMVSNWLINIIHREQHKEFIKEQTKEYNIKMQQLNKWLIPVLFIVFIGMGGLFISGSIWGAILGLIGGFGIYRAVMSHLNKKNKNVITTNEITENSLPQQQKNKEPIPENTKKSTPPDISKSSIYTATTNDDDNTTQEPTLPCERKSKSMRF